jgi:hypothetical protein
MHIHRHTYIHTYIHTYRLYDVSLCNTLLSITSHSHSHSHTHNVWRICSPHTAVHAMLTAALIFRMLGRSDVSQRPLSFSSLPKVYVDVIQSSEMASCAYQGARNVGSARHAPSSQTQNPHTQSPSQTHILNRHTSRAPSHGVPHTALTHGKEAKRGRDMHHMAPSLQDGDRSGTRPHVAILAHAVNGYARTPVHKHTTNTFSGSVKDSGIGVPMDHRSIMLVTCKQILASRWGFSAVLCAMSNVCCVGAYVAHVRCWTSRCVRERERERDIYAYIQAQLHACRYTHEHYTHIDASRETYMHAHIHTHICMHRASQLW